MGAPVRNTCPDIDRIIKQIRSALKSAEYGSGFCEDEKTVSCFENIVDDLYNLEGELEDLRSSNDKLREWGNDLESKLEDAAYEISELESKIIE